MDFFARQKVVPNWNNSLIQQQVALVLGVGGIGCSVARNLCRLGLSEVILVDYDVVAASNINRQVLYCSSDVGRRKIDAAVDGLQRDNITSKVTPVFCDAVKEWGRIVELAISATVVFNCIDYGEYFDYAVCSLCAQLSLPYVAASSYGHTAIAECYPVLARPKQGPCWGCNNAPAKKDVLQKLIPSLILDYKEIEFLPKDTYMLTNSDVGSSILPCSLGAMLATGCWLNTLHGYSLPQWTTADYATFNIFSYTVQSNPDCIICCNAPSYSKQTLEVYFGTRVVKLSPVEGEAVPYTDGCITDPVTEALTEEARQHLQPLAQLGEEYAHCYVPAIPAADMNLLPQGTAKLPNELQKPLLKTANGTVQALRSGGRSALMVTRDTIYRLKGCGNYLDVDGFRYSYPGFPLKPVEGKEDGGVEVKGCCFKHTAVTEQFMSEHVGKVLAAQGMVVGNRPRGMWKYSLPQEPLPKIEKWCGLFETLGERRLASHLLVGLDLLLPLMFPDLVSSHDKVLDLFPRARMICTAKGVSSVQPTWSAWLSKDREQLLVDLCTVQLQEARPSQGAAPHTTHLTPSLLGEWCQASYALRESLPLQEEESKGCGSLMAALYWELGWEVGVVKRLMEECGINWGYFIDHNPFEPHCNCHPNNFIILPPGEEKLLAPVDFDLAFRGERFFSPYTGQGDTELFQSWIHTEYEEMGRTLGGDQSNTGVQTSSGEVAWHTAALTWAFRDTMVRAYSCSYNKGANLHPLPDRLKVAMRALVTMALVLTANHTS
ncbi:hypothetical protein EMCRGX_G026057 [Ephydatia muelleri]